MVTTARSIRAILDTATAGAIATYRLQEAATAASCASLPTFDDPRRDAHEFYAVEIEGVEAGSLWAVRSWTRQLSARGVMRHERGQAAAVTITTP